MKLKTISDLRSQPKIATHDGTFHADDVVSIALLRLFGWKGELIRTRNLTILKDLVGIDVPGSATGGLFDHHGKDASPGVSALTKVWAWLKERCSSTQIDRFDHCMDYTFRSIAESDSGRKPPSCCNNMFDWVRVVSDGTDEGFEKSVEIALYILKKEMKLAGAWEKCLTLASEVLTKASRTGLPPIFEERGLNYKEALHQLGCSYPFFVSPSEKGSWNILRCCPSEQNYSSRGGYANLPKEWAVNTAEELQRISGYSSAQFAFAPGGNVIMVVFTDKKDAVDAAIKLTKNYNERKEKEYDNHR